MSRPTLPLPRNYGLPIWAPAGATKWDYLTKDQRKGYKNTPLNIPCSGCNTMLKTEADFAKHFVIKDLRWLNLGDCPINPRR